MRYFQRAAAATLVIGAALAASSASAATLITAAGGQVRDGGLGGTPYDNIPTGTLSIKGLGAGVKSVDSYRENVELAGTGFLAGLTGLGRFDALGVTSTDFSFTLETTTPDEYGNTYEIDFVTPRNITYAYDQVFAENTSLALSAFNGTTGMFDIVSFSANRGPSQVSARLNLSNSIVSNDIIPFVPVTTVTPAVPEPASWAMMMVGLGAVGYTMRRRQKVTTRVSFA